MYSRIIVEKITFNSKGNSLKGRTYRPTIEGKYPAVAICHGYPGDPKNMDLAEEMALNGVAVLVFYYQGAWGSEGHFRFSSVEPNTVDAINYLKSQSFVDPKRVGLISHSMGAIPLTNVMSNDRSIKTGVLIAPAVDLSKWIAEEVVDIAVANFLSLAEGKIDCGDEIEYKNDMIEAGKELGNLTSIVQKIEAPIMAIVGSADPITPPEHSRILIENAIHTKKLVVVDGADHNFSEHKLQLQRNVLEWLSEYL